LTISSAVVKQYRIVTDKRTDRGLRAGKNNTRCF